MAQNDIFRLLLILLLVINGYDDSNDKNTSGSCHCSLSGNLNQIILAVLLLSFSDNRTSASDSSATTF